MEKELKIRKRVLNIYNFREADFSSKKEYDDYLEEIEDIIFNLSEGTDVAETEARLVKYQRQHSEKIMLNAVRKAEETRQLAAGPSSQPSASTSGAADGVEAKAGDRSQPQGPTAAAVYVPGAPSASLQAPPMPMIAPQPLPAGGAGPAQVSLLAAKAEDISPEEQRRRVAAASGFTPDICKQRALQEAFSSILVS